MKRLRNCIVAMLLGCCAPVLIWVGVASAIYQRRKITKLFEEALPNLACSINSDCPPGYVCVNGYCILQTT